MLTIGMQDQRRICLYSQFFFIKQQDAMKALMLSDHQDRQDEESHPFGNTMDHTDRQFSISRICVRCHGDPAAFIFEIHACQKDRPVEYPMAVSAADVHPRRFHAEQGLKRDDDIGQISQLELVQNVFQW